MELRTAYNITDDDRMLIASMANLTPAPAIVLQTPLFGEVGENSFLQELRDLVYAKNIRAGLHRADGVNRHIAFRNLPYEGSVADYEHFTDGLYEVNPFIDKFYGVDVIDMTSWAGKSFSGMGWAKLKYHIQNYTDTDFVFVMKSESGSSDNLLHALQDDCGIPAEKIVLCTPKPTMLATFVKERTGFSDAHMDHLVEWIACVAEGHDTPLNYSWANRLATRVAMEHTAIDDLSAFRAFLEEYGPILLGGRAKKLGF